MALFLHKSYILLNFVSKFKYQLIYRMNIHKLGSLYGNALHAPKSSIPVVYQFVRNRLVADNNILTFATLTSRIQMTDDTDDSLESSRTARTYTVRVNS